MRHAFPMSKRGIVLSRRGKLPNQIHQKEKEEKEKRKKGKKEKGGKRTKFNKHRERPKNSKVETKLTRKPYIGIKYLHR